MPTVARRFLPAAALLLTSLEAGAACIPDEQTLCLLGNRFQVTVDWSNTANNPKTIPTDAASGSGTALPINENTGAFSLLGSPHYEILVRVLEGCPVNGHVWLFSAAATNIEYTLTVTDTETNIVKAYHNPQGTIAPPITDTSAFDACASGGGAPRVGTPAAGATVAPSDSIRATGSCVADGTTLCLHNNRFAVRVDWDYPGHAGDGTPVSLSDESGYFYFFSASNPELILNIYDGQVRNGHWWTFFAAITNVGYRVHIEDTVTGTVRTWSNEYGNPPLPVLDTGRSTTAPPRPIPTLGVLAILLLTLGVARIALGHRRAEG